MTSRERNAYSVFVLQVCVRTIPVFSWVYAGPKDADIEKALLSHDVSPKGARFSIEVNYVFRLFHKSCGLICPDDKSSFPPESQIRGTLNCI